MLYEIFEPTKNGTVSEWLRLVVEVIRNVWKRGKLPIVVGGTGFYIESLIKGVSPIPETRPETKEKVAKMFAEGGVSKVYEMLKNIDEKGAKRVNKNDTTRVRRALEIFLDTGVSIDEWFEKPMIKLLQGADFKVVALLPKLSDLEEKCSKRFDIMMKNGALDEVKNLLDLKLDANLSAMKAIGVPELADYLRGKITLDEAVRLAKLHTRQYAKRQLTWFRNRLKNIAEYIVD